jgi:aspartokinase/homoserine dehydrogenase 1
LGAIVVASAMRGVTDALLDLTSLSSRGEKHAARAAIDILRERHLATGRELSTDIDDPLVETINRSFDQLADVVDQISVAASVDTAISDKVAAYGERISASMLVSALCSAGVSARVVDATQIIHADERYGNATPDVARTTTAVNEHLLPIVGDRIVPVIAGFIGSAPNRSTVTLGRGGSDLTATTLARALGADTVTLWKDVPGILTADPQTVPDARLVPRLHVREAAELAYYGAKVLHPRALIGLRDETRPFIRPLADTKSKGTEVTTRRDRATERKYPVRAITAIGGQAIINISGDGMVGVPGVAARAFGALEKVGVSVALISQASSEHSICLVVPSAVAEVARAALREAFAAQLERQEIEGIDVRTDLSIMAVVGLGMSGMPGVASRLFAAIADSKVNVIAIAQGASELNISVVIEERQAGAAQRAVHAAFRLDKIGGGAISATPDADIVLLGFGRIGRELVAQIGAVARSRALRIVAVIDSNGYVFDPRGLSKKRLAMLATAKAGNTSLANVPHGVRAPAALAVAEVQRHALSRPILVDVTAGDTSAVLEAAIVGGMDIVLANKRPLSTSELKGGLKHSAASHGRRVLHEATVGAGLPLIDTISKLKESGDDILRIEGCPSGTLGYLFGELGKGTSFSSALLSAMTLGYTEPDPRDDLSGMDVARKALILGRLLGFKGTIDSVDVESLVPPQYRDMSASEFVSRLEELDSLWRERVEQARSRDCVLRYRLMVTSEVVTVGLVAVNSASSLASLMGTDNQFSITTTRYSENPIVITGPGAGVAVTAAGVLNDVLKIAGSR